MHRKRTLLVTVPLILAQMQQGQEGLWGLLLSILQPIPLRKRMVVGNVYQQGEMYFSGTAVPVYKLALLY